MFGLMKNLMKENAPAPPETVTLGELYAGCTVGFGFMPQKNISGKRLSVRELNSYLFTPDDFIAFRLEDDADDINLIVADEEEAPGAFLALSQRIEPRLFEVIFPGAAPQSWFSLKEGEAMDVNTDVLGPLQGWLAPVYEVALLTKGRFVKGDARLRPLSDTVGASRPFDYVLLVDDDNEFALEAEKYEDGTLNVFATVYRPATDIGEISRAPKFAPPDEKEKMDISAAPLSLPVEKIAHERPTEPVRSVPKITEAPAQDIQEIPSAKIEETSAVASSLTGANNNEIRKDTAPAAPGFPQDGPPVPIAAVALKEAVAEALPAPAAKASANSVPPEILPEALQPEVKPSASFNESVSGQIKESSTQPSPAPPALSSPTPAELPVHGKLGPIQETNAAGRNEGVLVCDLTLAGKLIEEAQRSRMPLSQLIRKVIDLPAHTHDQVFIPFRLDSQEQAELARRYQLADNDLEAVKQKIIGELNLFIGRKKS